MAKAKSWSGNTTSEFSLSGNELSNLASFCQTHQGIFIFGAGKIGKALKRYLTQSELTFTDFVTSADFNGFRKLYKQNCTGVVIGVGDGSLAEVLAQVKDVVCESDIFILSTEYRERIGNQLSFEYVRDNFWVNIFVTNRCNLGCRSCSTFAPVTSVSNIETDYDFDMFSDDIDRLNKMGLQTINCLKFTGGEPFLHPQLFEMFAEARSVFPTVPMECYTNGMLLGNIGDKQLTALRELNITLTVTEYPVDNFNLREFYEIADARGINCNVIFSDGQKMFSKRPLDTGKLIPKYCFFDCPRYTMCNSLFMYRGKLWKCIYSFNSVVFNGAFSTNLETLNGDCLNLYNIRSNDVYDFATGRIPFCGYCKPITELIPWGLSERKIEEWT